MRYNRVGYGNGSGSGRMRSFHGSSSSRGFRLNLKRFSVSRLRARFVWFFRLLSKCRWSSLSLKRSRSSTSTSTSTSKSRLVASSEQNNNNYYYYYYYSHGHHRRPTSLGRSNSFYAEAIADCLEFIKRSSISVDHS